MSIAPDPTQFDAPDPDGDRVAARGMLKELGQMAMELSRALYGLARAEAELAAATPADQPEARAEAAERAGRLAGHFGKAARAVRQCVALAARLERPEPSKAAGGPALGAEAMTPEVREAWQRTEARFRVVLRRSAVLNALEPLVRAEPVESERERLLDDLYERLDVASQAEDFVQHEPEALIERIHGEMGLPTPPGGVPLGRRREHPWMHPGGYGRQRGDP